MRKLRTFRTWFILLSGICFLNMTFLLAEISVLGLPDEYTSLVETLINSGLEEESEAGTESSEGEELFKEVFFDSDNNLTHHQHQYLAGQQREKILSNLSIHPGFLKRFSPPPERW